MVFPLFPRNSEAYQAFVQLQDRPIYLRSLDEGCHRVSYSASTELPALGAHNGIVNACEVWTVYAQQASQIPSSQNLFQEQVPWFYDSISLSPQRTQILQNLDSEIAALRSQNASSSDATLQIARGLYQWLTSELGIVPVNNIEEQGLFASLENQRANCSEFFSIFKFVFERAGLSVSPVFVFESVDGDRSEHVATRFEYNGQSYLMDPLYHSFDAQHRTWVPLTLREFWAWHFNNEATLISEPSQRSQMLQLFARAEQLDSFNPHFPNNLGLKLTELGDNRAAEMAYRRSIRIDANFVEPYVNLSALLTDQNRNREAIVFLQTALRSHPQDFRLHYNLAFAYYNLGRYSQAQSSIERAISLLDVSNPEYYSLLSAIRARIPHP